MRLTSRIYDWCFANKVKVDVSNGTNIIRSYELYVRNNENIIDALKRADIQIQEESCQGFKDKFVKGIGGVHIEQVYLVKEKTNGGLIIGLPTRDDEFVAIQDIFGKDLAGFRILARDDQGIYNQDMSVTGKGDGVTFSAKNPKVKEKNGEYSHEVMDINNFKGACCNGTPTNFNGIATLEMGYTRQNSLEDSGLQLYLGTPELPVLTYGMEPEYAYALPVIPSINPYTPSMPEHEILPVSFTPSSSIQLSMNNAERSTAMSFYLWEQYMEMKAKADSSNYLGRSYLPNIQFHHTKRFIPSVTTMDSTNVAHAPTLTMTPTITFSFQIVSPTITQFYIPAHSNEKQKKSSNFPKTSIQTNTSISNSSIASNSIFRTSESISKIISVGNNDRVVINKKTGQTELHQTTEMKIKNQKISTNGLTVPKRARQIKAKLNTWGHTSANQNHKPNPRQILVRQLQSAKVAQSTKPAQLTQSTRLIQSAQHPQTKHFQNQQSEKIFGKIHDKIFDKSQNSENVMSIPQNSTFQVCSHRKDYVQTRTLASRKKQNVAMLSHPEENRKS